jgi:carboxyl-terminal processing protease
MHLFTLSASRALTIAIVAATLSACGGGSSSGPYALTDRTNRDAIDGDGWVAGEFRASNDYYAYCENPRSGTDPYTGKPYPDVQGSYVDENNWLRSWSNELYLWYDEIPDENPADYDTAPYFQLLKTPEITATGTPKDQFHWSAPTEEYRRVNESGIASGYGLTWVVLSAVPPREVVLAYTEPDSPADAAGLARGARVLAVDGIDVDTTSDEGVDVLNTALFPSNVGQVHTFSILDAGSDTPRSVTLESVESTIAPVQNVGVIPTETGNVGYMLFNSHIATAETALVEAVEELQRLGASDLVLDLRYNGGGYLDIANQLAYMIAGSAAAGEVFEEIIFNDKHTSFDPVTGDALVPGEFHTTTQGFSEAAGVTLPTLNLDRVYVLTSRNTCSASESIINGLRGIDVEVVQIGGATCGKPYGAYMFHNCGTSYFTIQFKGANAKGYGDFTDGFFPGSASSRNAAELPGCEVADDFRHALGNPAEARLAAALHYRETGSCQSFAASLSPLSKSATGGTEVTPKQEGRVLQHPGLNDKVLRQ